MRCRRCGCTTSSACWFEHAGEIITCWWVEPNLCSFCSAEPPIDNVATGGLL